MNKLRSYLPNLSIKSKLMGIIMVTSTVALLLASAGFVAYEVATFRAKLVRDVSYEATLLGGNCAATIEFDRPDEAEEMLSTFLRGKHIVATAFYKDNQFFASYPSPLPPGLLPEQPAPRGHRFTGDHLLIFQNINYKGREVGVIAMRADVQEIKARLNRYAWIVGSGLFLSLLVSFLISSLLQRVVSNPISHLAHTARRVSAEQNYSLRASKTGEDELGMLVTGFNQMLERIEQRDGQLQQAHNLLEQRVNERTHELSQEVAQRKRAQEELQQQLRRIRLLNEVTYAIAAKHDLDSIFRVLLQQLEDRLPADASAAYQYDAEARSFTLLGRGPKGTPIAAELGIPQELSLAATPFGPAIEGALVYVPSLAELQFQESRLLAQAGLNSMVVTPLVIDGRLFGVLLLERREENAFTPEERDFIKGLAAHCSLAVHHAKLFQDLADAYQDVRQTQQAVMQQQRLQALGQMASGIAHDVNNALSPVIAYADLVSQIEPNLTGQSRRLLGIIRTSGEDIAHIVSRMRDFYRKRDGSEQSELVQLNHLADQVLDLTRPRWKDILEAEGIPLDVQVDYGTDLPPITGLASELREAVTNLILNAVDALPQGGVITVRTRLRAWNQEDGAPLVQHVTLEVQDNGIGMNEETRRRCLEPFFSTKGKRGTGLGLAMVYGVMERHDAAIEVESEPGKGTTMRLIFPVKKGSGSQCSGEPQPFTALTSLRILCIDDEPLIRTVLKDILEREGHSVEVADGGLSGVEAFRRELQLNPFNVVITDLGMPKIDGRQVAQMIKRESPMTPVIMLTGWGTMMQADGDKPSQVDCVLSKPPRINEIRQVLATVTTHRHRRGMR
jgi:signal transduction histidine kinase/ActR/RegA family two-component response regulator